MLSVVFTVACGFWLLIFRLFSIIKLTIDNSLPLGPLTAHWWNEVENRGWKPK